MGRVTQLADGTFTGHEPERPPVEQRLPVEQTGILWTRWLTSGGRLPLDGWLLCGQIAKNYSGDIPWVNGYPSPIDGAVGSTSAMSINFWVAQE